MAAEKKKRTIYKIGALSLLKKLEYSKQLDQHIKEGTTGSLEELAENCGYTFSLTTDLLVFMIEHLNCPIRYSKESRTYYYDSEGDLRIGFYPIEE
ncbi:MAG TPA: hypothetical protein VKB19_15595 [Pedobacter sp.]|nr:hypothetical protein [Pedobacter sp.]